MDLCGVLFTLNTAHERALVAVHGKCFVPFVLFLADSLCGNTKNRLLNPSGPRAGWIKSFVFVLLDRA
jgi:hypothetical protein